MRVIISGGGTGGHIFPALAVAKTLKAKSANIEILFVGAQGRMEMDKVPAHGFEIIGLPVAGVQRKLSFSNLKVPFLLTRSLLQASKIITDFQPDVVAGFGGYASAPVMYMAQKRGIPTLIQEQNSYAGWTNKLLAKRADAICVAYPKMEKFFPKEHIQLTGNPVRTDLQDPDHRRQEAIAHFGREQNKKTLLLFGGSLGAKTLNEAMKNAEDLIARHADYDFIWQCGKYHYDDYNKCGTAQLHNVTLLPFIDRMDLAYSLADLVICRAGALTISELTLVARPAVLVPSPNVAEDHQTLNAQALVDRDAAWMIKDIDANDQLISFALECVENTEQLAEKSAQLKQLARPEAADVIAQKILQLAG